MLELRARPRLSTHISGLPFSAPVLMVSTDAQSSACQAGAPHTGRPWQRRGREHAPRGQRTSPGRPAGEALPSESRENPGGARVRILLSSIICTSLISDKSVVRQRAVAGKGGLLTPWSAAISGRSGEGEPASVLPHGQEPGRVCPSRGPLGFLLWGWTPVCC